jgi:O-antigen/teichoic acid export membrane protein
MSKDDSYRQILRSTSIIGGASVLNIVIGLVRIKVAALVLGPVGVGLIGLFNNLLVTASAVASLGIGTVGTRQIAEAAGRDDPAAVATVRHAMMWGTVLLAAGGTLIFWLLRGTLATHVLADASLGTDVGWLALGVGLTVVTGSQAALLNGLRRIGDLARVTVYSALISAVLGSAALLIWREKGLLIFLLLAPLAKFALGQVYVTRLPSVSTQRPALRVLGQQWNTLARLGAAFMVAGLVTTLGQLVVRAMVQRGLGTDALGHFEAAWVISMTYIGFVLSAMGTDYYPRLTAAVSSNQAVNNLVNEQSEVALLLAGPIFLIMLGIAPWVIELLYSPRFAEAAAVLRWQILGDILKVVSWPLGFVILAKGNGRGFMLSETFAIAVFVAGVWIALPALGLQATGMAFLAMYVAYLPLVYWMARRSTGFRWARNVSSCLAALLALGGLIAVVSAHHALTGAALGTVAGTAFGLFALGRLAEMGNLRGPIGKLGAMAGKLTKRTDLKND